jgi:hypothetical protein
MRSTSISGSVTLDLERSRNSMDGVGDAACLCEGVVKGWIVLRAGN